MLKQPRSDYKYKLSPIFESLILINITLLGLLNIVNDLIATIFVLLYFKYFLYVHEQLPANISLGLYLPDKNLLLKNAKTFSMLRFDELGKIYYELVLIYSIAIDQDCDLAINKLKEFSYKKNPKIFQLLIDTGKYSFYTYCRNFKRIIDELAPVDLDCSNDTERILHLTLSRAYLEQGDYENAYRAVNTYIKSKPKLNLRIFALLFLPHYAFIADLTSVKEMIKIINNRPYELPDYFINYWLARTCLIAKNNTQASDYLVKGKFDLTKKNNPAFWLNLYSELDQEINNSNSIYYKLDQSVVNNFKICLDNYRKSLK